MRVVTRADMYACELCNTVYDTELEAIDCERSHVSKERMNIANADYMRQLGREAPERGFPSTIRVSDNLTGNRAWYAYQGTLNDDTN